MASVCGSAHARSQYIKILLPMDLRQTRALLSAMYPKLAYCVFAVLVGGSLPACVDDIGDLRRTHEPDPVTDPIRFVSVGGDDAGLESEPEPADEVSLPPTSVTYPDPLLDEPRRDFSLTLMHGVVDASRVYFCLLVTPEGEEPAYLSPTPLPSAGLSFGQSMVVAPEADDEPLLAARSVQVFVVAASQNAATGQSCEALLLAGGRELPSTEARDVLLPVSVPVGPGFSSFAADAGFSGELVGGSEMDASRVPAVEAGVLTDAQVAGAIEGGALSDVISASAVVGHDSGLDGSSVDGGGARFRLPELRASVLTQLPGDLVNEQFSYLLVASGCLGAPGLHHELERRLCGPAFGVQASTLAPVFVPLSRVASFGDVGLQVVNANQAFPSATVRSNPPEGVEASFFTIAREVPTGGIAPRPAVRGIAADSVGRDYDRITLDISESVSNSVRLSIPWFWPLSLGEVPELRNGRSYSVVVIGPEIGIAPGPWWNPGFLALIKNDPIRDLD
jgi:hypothetical protein